MISQFRKLGILSSIKLAAKTYGRFSPACSTNDGVPQKLSVISELTTEAAVVKTSACATTPNVAILLCTYQGESFLDGQLQSFMAQTFTDWTVFASDDGSTDKTHEILEAYQLQWGNDKLSLYTGPAKGFAANFLSITCRASICADFYAYSDQDDIWEADKLQRAIDWLQKIPKHVPSLYCTRTRLVDDTNTSIGLSPLFKKPPCFANALMQNIGGGNTMVFNNAARQLICHWGDQVNVVAHDWWAYLLVSGCGGQVFYDPYPSIRYRQHDNNIVGQNNNWRARIKRIRLLGQGEYKNWNNRHITALQKLKGLLTPENQELLQLFAVGRKQPLVTRLLMLKRAGIKRQSMPSNIALIMAAVFGKI
jgi:glycosyltransferase involved in cell wall biosynthesis